MKLSESGKLFFNAYTLLLDARSELHQYFTDVIRKSKMILQEYVDEKAPETPCKLKVHALKNNKSNLSRVAIQITVPSGNHSGVSGDIRVICFDMRNHEYVSSTQAPATIEVWSAISNIKIRSALNQLADETYGEDIFGNYDLLLPMNSSEEDAKIVADAITMKCEQLMALLPLL